MAMIKVPRTSLPDCPCRCGQMCAGPIPLLMVPCSHLLCCRCLLPHLMDRGPGGTRLAGQAGRVTWNPCKVAVCVLTLLLLLNLLLLALLPFHHFATTPYTAERVALHAVDSESPSLTGSLCGHRHGCSARYDDWVSDVLVTSDWRVVLAMDIQQSMVVRSSSGEQTVPLGCTPAGMTELPSKRIAVVCRDSYAVLVVSLESSDPQVQRIPTGKEYFRVAAHPVDQTLIVATWPSANIDVITLQGELVRPLVDAERWILTSIYSLTVTGGSLLVTGEGSEPIHWIPLSDSSNPPVETLEGSSPPWPADAVVDEAGNVFIVLEDGGVLIRNTQGHYRRLREGRSDGKTYVWCHIALHGDRLLVATLNPASEDWKSVVTEYQLLDR